MNRSNRWAESFGQFMAAELKRYAEVVKLSGAKVE